jgi:excisionase family DNA binding protein
MPRRKASVPGPTYHTTHQVAKILGVSLPTVVNWVNQGLLPAHRTPGGHRRIARNDITQFAREHEYPLAREFVDQAGASRKVLIVDDEADFAEMVRDYLTLKGGFEVGVAESGFQAGYTVARFRPDLILMDIMMPGMDGFEVYRVLRGDSDTRHIPVIACTAYRDPAIDLRVRDEQFDGLVEKPLKLDDLLALIRRQLGLDVDEV